MKGSPHMAIEHVTPTRCCPVSFGEILIECPMCFSLCMEDAFMSHMTTHLGANNPDLLMELDEKMRRHWEDRDRRRAERAKEQKWWKKL